LPARALRLLLAGDARFWAEPPLSSLESFLESTAERLQLEAAERDVVARTVASACARTLLAGWGTHSRGRATSAAAPSAFVSAHGDAVSRASLAVMPLLRTSRPLGLAFHAARGRTRNVMRDERLLPLRRHARRSRVLRFLYTKVLGFRLSDD
jgi:hypothetical protein